MRFPTRNYIVLFVLCLALIIPGAVSASQQTMLLVSGSGTQSAGYTTTQPSVPLDPAGYGGVWSPAVASSDIASTWYLADKAPFGSGAVWISSAAVREGANSEDQWRLFRQDFNLPAGSTIDSANLAYTADNAVTVYLNGVEISSTGQVNDAAPVDHYYYKTPFSVGLTPVTGTNSMLFVVRNFKNSGFNPTALLYKATIEYTVQDTPVPEFPSVFLPVTMIIGVLGAVLFIQRTREL